MKRNYGFTLIELLAVIVVLGVIALIATPTVLHLIEKSRREAFKDSVINAFSTLDYYLIQHGKGTFKKGILNGIGVGELSLKDDFIDGSFVTLEDGTIVSYFIKNNRYCSYGEKKDLKIARNCLELDQTAPVIDRTKYKITSKTNRIDLFFEEGFASEDKESYIKNYVINLYLKETLIESKKIEGKEIERESFTGLTADTLYRVEIIVTNGNNIEGKIEEEVRTKEIGNPIIVFRNTPNQAVEGYVKGQVAEVRFQSENIESPSYYIKTGRKGYSSEEVTEECGSGTIPGVCTERSAQRELKEDTWYKVTESIEITYEEDSNENKTMYAVTYDGNNYSGAATGTILKIDKTEPTLELGEATSTSNRINIPIKRFEDSGVGIEEIESCRYGVSNGNYPNQGSRNGNTSCSLNGLTKDTTYYYEVCGVDKLGNKNCKRGNTASKGITNPGILLVNSPTSAIGGFLDSQKAKVTFVNTNVESPRYYIRALKEGVINKNTLEECGSGTMPGSCVKKSVTRIEEGKWYLVGEREIEVTYNEGYYTSVLPTMYALTYDGNNYSGAATATLTNIFYKASEVTYGKNGQANVEKALDDLYSKLK